MSSTVVAAARQARRPSAPRLGGREQARDRLYAWWWWRSPNRPNVTDRRYLELLDALPADAVGLDLGSRQRVREGAITLDVVAADGVDVVGDGHDLPFVDNTFDYVWCNAVLEHVRDPAQVAREIVRVLKPGGLAIVQVPFLEHVHGWPDDYYRFTLNGLRTIFSELDEVAAGVAAGPGQVLPDLIQYYATGFSDVQRRGLVANSVAVAVGTLLLPLRWLDRALRRRPSYWQWARSYYYAGRKSLSLAGDPARTRVAFVAPGRGQAGFEPMMRVRSRDMVRALQRAGADVAAVPFDAAGDDVARALVEFGPELVVAPNMNYYLAAYRGEHDLFRRIGAPPALLWDDPLGALSLWLLQERRGRLGSLGDRGDGDPLEAFRRLMSADGARHYAWDSGHAEAVVELGLAPREAITWYPIATFGPFLEQGRRGDVPEEVDVAFCGNVYASAVGHSNFTGDDFYEPLTQAICARKLGDLGASSWRLLNDVLGELPEETRHERGLTHDRTPFWDYYLYVAWMALTTAVRLELLTSIERPVTLYGLFADPESVALVERHPNLIYGGNRDQFRELPQTFAATKVNVCISNGLIYEGIPSKLIDCLASGGFALADPKGDLARLFGDEVDAIVFRDADELNAKIEYYLARPAERREIVHALRRTIVRECTLERLMERVLEQAPM